MPHETHDNAYNMPLYETLTLLAERDQIRLHMPGHKGKPLFSAFAGTYPIDFTEMYDTGNLYQGIGPIREAETLTADYYQSSDCFFLTGGSTQGICSMLASLVKANGSLLVARDCHQSVLHACTLLDLTPYFLYPETIEPFGVPGLLAPDKVRDAFLHHPDASALLLTSPTYYGVLRDIPALAAVCKECGKLLLIDAAHGAHLPALHIPSPVAQGANAAVLSIHKTLPALGQAAVLLMDETIDTADLREQTSVFGTSSPSYPIMASIDTARAWLMGKGAEQYRHTAHAVDRLRRRLLERTPFRPLQAADAPLDLCRLTVCCAQTKLTGIQLARHLYEEHDIVCEMMDQRNIVCILTGVDNALTLSSVGHALERCGKAAGATAPPKPLPPFPPAHFAVSVRQAYFSPHHAVTPSDAVGRICARPVTPYPPGIPLLWPGEKIERAHIEFLREICYTMLRTIEVLV